MPRLTLPQLERHLFAAADILDQATRTERVQFNNLQASESGLNADLLIGRVRVPVEVSA